MAAEADRVVVELIAKNDQFEQAARQTASTFEQSMSRIAASAANAEAAVSRGFTQEERSLARMAGPAAEAELRHRRLAAAIRDTADASGGAEVSHKRLTASVGNSRIAMLEFQHIARGTADQIAAGAPLTQVLAQHMGMLSQAVSLAGGSFGRVGAFLGGPWGIALTLAAAGVATLIMRHKEEGDTLDDLVKKLQEHHDKATLNADANDIWKHSIDGVIESEKALADQLDKTLVVQSVAQRQALTNAQGLVALRAVQLQQAEGKYTASDPRFLKAQEAFHQAVRILHDDLLTFGEQEGAALTDLGARADQWADKQTVIVRSLQTIHPELQAFGADINAAFALMKKAVSDAAGADVPFDNVTRQVDALNNKLAQSPGSVREYIAEMKKLAAQLEATAEAAKKAGKIDAVAQFKAGVIGAEGTGPNRLGSSAAGFGQFMPATWLSYFDKLFPQFSNLPRDAKLDYRNDKTTATAVIDKATDDYVGVLKAAGQQITAAALYTVHLLGSRDAMRLLGAPAGQQTSDFLSGAVLRGNPFLRGTAGDARAAIGGRIGDSSGAVSSAAASIANQQAAAEQRLHEQLTKSLGTEQQISLVKENQAELSREITGHVVTLDELLRSGVLPSLKSWEKEYDTIIHSQEELNRFGGQLIDEVLNPDNWSSWGDMGKRILHELEVELITLAAINPLKNLLTGGTLPTLGGVLGKLGGLFGGGGTSSTSFTVGADTLGGFGTVGLAHLAGGGTIGGFGGTDNNVLSINGQPRAMVSGNETLAVIPSNARAASPASAQVVQVLLGVEASEYFDARVLRTTGPVIAQSSVAAANGGASIGRRNLERESRHRL